jgi:hypothetical protein
LKQFVTSISFLLFFSPQNAQSAVGPSPNNAKCERQVSVENVRHPQCQASTKLLIKTVDICIQLEKRKCLAITNATFTSEESVTYEKPDASPITYFYDSNLGCSTSNGDETITQYAKGYRIYKCNMPNVK